MSAAIAAKLPVGTLKDIAQAILTDGSQPPSSRAQLLTWMVGRISR
jgi:hypothetical protein